ncbi:MAG: HNH endonuclease [Phycisphaerales bacterium]|nr:HNH endonuclease [Phycisphaerales bacterium]
MPTQAPRHRPPQPKGVLRHEIARPSSHARGYDKAWQKLAQRFRLEHPFCADPFGHHGHVRVRGEHVDHAVALARGGTNEWSNLQTLCASCHSRKTIGFDGGFGRPKAVP